MRKVLDVLILECSKLLLGVSGSIAHLIHSVGEGVSFLAVALRLKLDLHVGHNVLVGTC